MNHAAASTVNVVTDGLLLDHGEMETRPMPAPSATSARENAEATKAPAITAGQDTPEAVSIVASRAVAIDKGARAATVVCVIFFESPLARRNPLLWLGRRPRPAPNRARIQIAP